MKRLLLIAVMVLVSLVGMVGFGRAAESQNDTPTMSAISNAVSALQTTAKATNGAVTEPPATVNAGTEYNWTAYYDPTNGAVTEPPATVNAGVPAKPRMYYLTVTGFTGGDAITACDSGFHMASISEIQDPSNLQYATRSTTSSITVYDSIVALVDQPPFDQASDQFQYPDHTGWVRTEADSLTGLVRDCEGWESSSDQQSATTYAALWQLTQTASCSQPEPVWCVEDPVMTSAICTGMTDQQGGDCI